MRNDGQKPQGVVPRSGRSNGFIPNSFRTISSYWRIVSSGASTVASTVRSAGASVASSIVDRDDDASRDQVQWAGFDKLECDGDIIRQVLLLGYRSGFQVWDVEEANNVLELVSRHDGPVSFLQMQPKPIGSKGSEDKFVDDRPLLVVVGDGMLSGGGNNQDGLAFHCNGNGNGNVTTCQESANGNIVPTIVRFYSLRSQSYVHILKFRSAVYSVRCSPRVVAISQASQVHCFDAVTLEREYTIVTCPIVSGSIGSGGIGYGPLAVGPRWLAYSGSPVLVSNTGRVSPQHLTPAASFSGSSDGSLVAHYAKESSKQLAAGIVTLGDMGYKKLSRYCSELLPDGSNSLKPGSPGWKNNGTVNGHSLDTDNIGMVIVRDIVSKSVVTQFRAHRSPISSLCFDHSGILLVTASVQGHNINVFRIIPPLAGNSSGSDTGGSYVHLYRLQRGFTNAIIQDISFSEDSHWIMISSSRGTSHLFAISPSGGSVNLQSTGSGLINGNNGLGVMTKIAVRWPSNSGPSKLNQQSFCASGPPVTLTVVSRIKNGNNGWKGTVSGAAAAATGRASSLSGAIASAFHNCKGNDLYSDNRSLTTKYHLLVFSPSGCVIQYVLRLSNGPESGMVLPGLSTPYESSPDSDVRLVVEALQKWDICQRQTRRDREDNLDIYGEQGYGRKIFPEGTKRMNLSYPSEGHALTKAKINAEERNHLYISEAELQMHQAQIPLWAKSELMMMDDMKIVGKNSSGGEIEIEKIPARMIEARSKDLVPVFDNLQTPKYQQPRMPAVDNKRNCSPHQRSGLSEDGRLSCRSSCSSIDCMSEVGTVVGEHQSGIEENGWGGRRTLLESTEGFVSNNDSPKMKTRPEFVNNREILKMDTNLEFVNNNKESLKMENHLEDDSEDD
ncbi:autophagy-related protein 18f-like isoform X2 [Macadamia integrifolia]|uniref:autophagy-related protein 18f-like isoform X2 n=1 Tax=Macadamia integrifolia TaxID=60698 RepID=UPI001C4EC1FB|nr:autophagy-related protein 18f-like isoform X2 [Macadamia integrifolia]